MTVESHSCRVPPVHLRKQRDSVGTAVGNPAVIPTRRLTWRERRAAARYRRETGMDLPIEERVRESLEQRGRVKVRPFRYVGPQ